MCRRNGESMEKYKQVATNKQLIQKNERHLKHKGTVKKEEDERECV